MTGESAPSAGPLAASVVLPTRNRPEMALEAARRVLACCPAAAELVIVDQSDAPDPALAGLGSAAHADCFRAHVAADVRYEWLVTPGLSLAVNHGVAVARHDAVLIVHDDALAAPGWVDAHVTALAAGGSRTVVTGRIVAGEAEHDDAFAPSLAPSTTPRRYEGYLGYDVLKSLNLSFHRAWFDELGGFDTGLGPGTPFPGAEDADFGHRVLRAGGAIQFEPAALVTHRAWREGDEYLALRWRYGFAHGAFYAKHTHVGDREMLRRFAHDVLRRARRFPRRVAGEGRRALGDPLFVIANVAGAIAWQLRTLRRSRR